MFQTQFTIWFQQFSTPGLDAFFLALTWLGYETFLQAFLVFIVFGINVRYGFMLSQAIIWTAAVIEVFKSLFGSPRPFMVDNRIKLIDQSTIAPSVLTDGGGRSFWSWLPSQSVESAHANYNHYSGGWGIPSGHAAGSIVIWGSLMYWFKQPKLWLVCMALILLIPLSRLYLGMHFIADLLLGYAIGLLMFMGLIRYFFQQPAVSDWLFSGQPQKLISRSSGLFLLVFVLPGCGALFSSTTSLENVTLILGSNLGFFGVWLKGVPTASQTLKDDVIRLAIAYPLLFAIIAIDRITDPWIVESFGKIAGGVQEILLNGFLIYVGVELLIKLGFMTRGNGANASKPN